MIMLSISFDMYIVELHHDYHILWHAHIPCWYAGFIWRKSRPLYRMLPRFLRWVILYFSLHWINYEWSFKFHKSNVSSILQKLQYVALLVINWWEQSENVLHSNTIIEPLRKIPILHCHTITRFSKEFLR